MAEEFIKRLRYFDKQFLVEADFTDEQKYHLGMRRRHNRLLHTPGIAQGLEIQKTDAKKVKVTPGTALDSKGQEIVLFTDFSLDLSNATSYPPNSTVYITIEYQEEATDPQPPEKPENKTRTVEKPLIKAITNEPSADDTVIQLAKFKLDSNGNVPGNVGLDGGVRKSVGAVLADNAISIRKLKKELRDDRTITLNPGASERILAFTAPLSAPTSAFLLIYAYSTTPGAIFRWEQEYSTVGTLPNLSTNQTVIFRNVGTGTNAIAISITFKIYAVLES
jgi:hypothetical protein